MKAGITGHQELGGPSDVTWLRNTLLSVIRNNKITIGYSSLARGADQVFAESLQVTNLPYIVILPCKGYEETFQDMHDLENFRFLLSIANSVIKLPFDSPNEQAFWEAGQKVVNMSDIIIAVWDGQPAKGLGGTGDVVQYAKSLKKQVIQLNIKDHSIQKI